ncbi:DUF1345 domain-containing protein [Arthrobacter sp. AET 35A]|uniref:DUF1345 domain-containing protein n=1 Tax=Arthrobacter sp. AET 35A TaxID=2292643 RepID=UPI001780F9A8|nr:DUF1345 domain-containing protein [Arthrobacter sp. AET 35A]MBE0011078.1 DUF1345 domain-containing protein [Arthrobacter sp. AET 35A]
MTNRILSARRALICLAVGTFGGVVAAVALTPALAPLIAWCTAGVLALAWVWRICWRQSPEGTKRIAQEESASRVTDNAIVTACIASIAAVAVALVQSSNQTGDPVSVALVILGVLGTMVAWALVNTVYALKYARMYFIDHGADGFDVKQETDPTYSDFAYFAFTIGMSYAGPEVEPINTEIRRKALFHALLSYFFGTVLIAVAINLVTNLGQG